ncbi:MAG: DUF454 domain-containing protein [Gammaproteobacteria bacterium]|jgi:uncharacterized membrane protein YbaN (DUF454 family)|nr:DUF454 domain-containing protein [Gammaproteobacteria bacterium]
MSKEVAARPVRLVENRLLRWTLFGLGWLSASLGVLGIFLPLLPTTPFMLLAAGCFARSSERFYCWITSHPKYGPMIADYLAGKGLPMRAKYLAVSLLWLSILFGVYWVDFVWAKLAMLLTAVAVTAYLWRLPVAD